MPTVVLVHGMWMNGWDMALLGRRLRAAGYSTRRFSYPSVRGTIDSSADLLHHFLAQVNDHKIHFVAHSLGGLLVRHLAGKYPDDVNARVVTLGTPHQGSHVARVMSRSRAGVKLMGRSIDSLQTKIEQHKPGLEIGVIAGSKPLGSGMLVTRMEKPHDGTVLLSETKFDGMSDYRVVPTNHMGLLFSRIVSEQVIEFLGTGHFS